MSSLPTGHHTARAMLGMVFAGAVAVALLTGVRAGLVEHTLNSARTVVLLVYDTWPAEPGAGS